MTALRGSLGSVYQATRTTPKSVQFLAAGGLGYVLGAVLLWTFIDVLGLPGQLAYWVSVAITLAFVWLVNRYVTWREHAGSIVTTLPSFVVGRLMSVLLAWVLFTTLVGRMIRFTMIGDIAIPVHYQLANAIGVGFATVANYLVCKHVVFVEAPHPGTDGRGRNRVHTFGWLMLAAFAGAGIVLGILLSPFGLLLTLWVLNAVLMTVVAGTNASRMLYGWQRPDRVSEVDLVEPVAPELRFSLIVPARHEPILGGTLRRLLDSDYPAERYEILVVVADDDPDTEALALEVAANHANVHVVIDAGEFARSKPRSLEIARPLCTGDLVGVVDAESVIAPGLLSYVNSLAIGRPDIGVFQGGVQLMNHRAAGWTRTPGSGPVRTFGQWLNGGTSWWRARNCLEYYVWFVSRLRYQAQAGFVPLGGNTVFIRRGDLNDLGGWDPDCLTEDCELGVRAAVAGVQTVVFHRPDLVTLEETPSSLAGLVVQRTRWMSGFLQVFRKGDWKNLPRRQRRLAFEALTMPLFQAYAGVASVISVTLAVTLRAPVPLVLIVWVPFLVTVVNIGFEHAAYRDFTRAFGLRRSAVDSIRFILASPFYQLVLSVAGIRSVVRLARGLNGWEKTAHSGQHLVELTPVGSLLATVPDLQAAS